ADGWEPEKPGVFTLLNDTHDLGSPPNWQGPGDNARDPALWLFHLHYWDWAAGDATPEQLSILARLVASWLDSCPLGISGGFRGPCSPYTVARRLPNWLIILHRFRLHGLDGELQGRMERAILGQGAWLARHLEWEHRGNHLLENLYALAFLSFFTGETENHHWRMLADQLGEQILPGGAHGEGSAMYHCLVLDRLLDLASMDRHATHSPMPGKFRKLLHRVIRRMAGFLNHILPPGGMLPRLGDTADGMVPRGEDILKRASSLPGWERNSPTVALRSGHWVCRDNTAGNFLLFDACDGGLPFLGAHQHADLLNFQLTLKGRQVITSGGAGIYKEGPERSASRSSREHATVVINKTECAEPWKSFRLGRRGRVRLLDHSNSGNHVHATATHDGFQHLGVALIRRMEVDRQTFQTTIIDKLESSSGAGTGGKNWRVSIYLPLAPGIVGEVDGNTVRLMDETDGRFLARIKFTATTQGRLDLTRGRYYQSFGLSSVRFVLRWRCRMSLGQEIITEIDPRMGHGGDL
ncbi:MAG: heparinase II/III family protein, partial [Candidatus Sumerlaeia bacterium]|nr:heparinase II/III family protein [Candidatus Sumerlaeia bacterium]